ncbi:MAG: DUF4212 domain-containing protein, partial [Paucibacter sp.]|nr:DUF4212 domain-containing protein [Roseateles sp.]
MDDPDNRADERPEDGAARRAREHRYWRRTRALLVALLALWAGGTFGLVYCARALNAWSFAGWPLGYWLAAQGIPL